MHCIEYLATIPDFHQIVLTFGELLQVHQDSDSNMLVPLSFMLLTSLSWKNFIILTANDTTFTSILSFMYRTECTTTCIQKISFTIFICTMCWSHYYSIKHMHSHICMINIHILWISICCRPVWLCTFRTSMVICSIYRTIFS